MNLRDFRSYIIADVEKACKTRADLIDQLAAIRQEQEIAMQKAMPYLLNNQLLPNELVAELLDLRTKYSAIEEMLARKEISK